MLACPDRLVASLVHTAVIDFRCCAALERCPFTRYRVSEDVSYYVTRIKRYSFTVRVKDQDINACCTLRKARDQMRSQDPIMERQALE